jgi:Transposase DDE domain
MRIRTLLEQHTITDLFTIVYIVVDDYINTSLENNRFTLPRSTQQKSSYSEIITIALVGELLRQAVSEHWYIHVKHFYKHLFPNLPDLTRYHRILKNLERIMADFALCLAQVCEDDTTYVGDSKPLSICRFKRRKQPRAMTEATTGFSTSGPTFGFKLHGIINNALMFVRFAIVPANEANPTVFKALTNAETDELDRVLGDKAYLGCGIFTPSRVNALQPMPWTRLMDAARKLIEVAFSSLARGQFLCLGQLNSFWSVRACVCRKVAGHNLRIWLGL